MEGDIILMRGRISSLIIKREFFFYSTFASSFSECCNEKPEKKVDASAGQRKEGGM